MPKENVVLTLIEANSHLTEMWQSVLMQEWVLIRQWVKSIMNVVKPEDQNELVQESPERNCKVYERRDKGKEPLTH